MFFKERWFGFDDALYTGARLLEIVSRWPNVPDGANWPLKHLPNASRRRNSISRCRKASPCAGRQAAARRPLPAARELITIDGVRAEYADGFGLARASNTTPVVVLRFEADSKAA